MTIEQIKQLEYVGGWYFRVKAKKGVKSDIIHGPEFLKVVLELCLKNDQPSKT